MQKKEKKLSRILCAAGVLIICILLDIGGRFLADRLQLPFWLDTVGTCLAAYLMGPVGAVTAGIINNVLIGVLDPKNILYMVVSVVIGLLFCVLARRKYILSLTGAMISSFLVGVFAIIISTPVNLLFNSGMTSNLWADAAYELLTWNGIPKLFASFFAQMIIEIPDKQLSVLIVYIIVRLLGRFFPECGFYESRAAFRFIRKTAPAVEKTGCVIAALLLSAVFAGLNPAAVYSAETADFFEQNWQPVIYDGSKGMPASEANAIEETNDGYIWIGSYAGLCRYDGTNFEYITEGGADRVTAMLTDSRERLWIGTNDNGVICYENGEFTNLKMEDGLSSNTIRCITEGEDGTIYIGTTDSISKLTTDGSIEVIDCGISYVYSLCEENGCLYGVTNTGALFCVENESKVEYLSSGQSENSYTCVKPTSLGLLAATSEGEIHVIRKTQTGISVRKVITLTGLNSIASISVDSSRRIWLCADNGMGYLDSAGKLHTANYEGFENSIENMHEDYEGNLWFASSRYGVLKLAKNQFENLFTEFGEPETVVNTVLLTDSAYYCGTDTGLVIFDKNGKKVENELTGLIADARVRNIIEDSSSRLWISTYGENGMVLYDPKTEEITCFNTKNAGTTTDKFRCAIELQDGTIAAGTANGINFFRNGTLAGTLTSEDGLRNGQILCMAQAEDGTVYAGSDGGGIYVIRDKKIVDTISTDRGLSSGVIMRMTEYAGGWFCVTSNALCYLKNGTAERLDTFPYFNNYDLFVIDKKAYVLSSTGIFVSSAADLVKNEFAYSLYNNDDGLQGGLTANSWCDIESDGSIYLCCNDGVVRWENETRGKTEYRYGVALLTADGTAIRGENGRYTIPADARHIEITASVRNYSLMNLKVRMFVEGMEEETLQTASQHALKMMQLTSLPYGDYTLHLQILSDDESEVRDEKTFLIHKETNLWEQGYYKVYLILVLAWITAFTTWVLVTLVQRDRRRKELEKLRIDLENKVTQQTRQIQSQADEMQEFQWSVVENMASIIESRDGNTGAHVINVRQYANLIAESMLEKGLHPETVTRKFVDDLTYVAPLHDVGKIKISDLILNKPGKLTAEEFEAMKKHTIYGRAIVHNILSDGTDKALIQMGEDVALYHHERLDGSGYPYGLSGEDIPIAARIIAVADVFDALVSERVYKKPVPIETALTIIYQGSGTQFDPEIVDVFLDQESKLRRLQK